MGPYFQFSIFNFPFPPFPPTAISGQPLGPTPYYNFVFENKMQKMGNMGKIEKKR